MKMKANKLQSQHLMFDIQIQICSMFLELLTLGSPV